MSALFSSSSSPAAATSHLPVHMFAPPDDDFDDDDDDDYDVFYDDDPLRNKKRICLGDFLPQAKVPDEPIDWGLEAKAKQPRLILLRMGDQNIFLDDLRLATVTGNLDYVRQFFTESKLGPDVALKDEWTPLMSAANNAQPDVVLFLLQSGADANASKKGFTVLMSAVCADPIDKSGSELEQRIIACISHLVSFGAKVDAADTYRTTALHFAVKKNRIQVVKCMLAHKANVNSADSCGYTAVHLAAKLNFGHIVRILMESGADLNLCDDYGQKPEDVAFGNNCPEIGNLISRCRKDKSLIASDSKLNDLEPIDQRIGLGSSDTTTGSEDVDEVSKFLHNDFQVFLHGFRLSDLESQLAKHDISTLPEVLKLEEEDLDKIGILSHRKKELMKAIEAFRSEVWTNQSALPVPKKQISSPELYNFLVNVTRQLKYIEATLSVVENNFRRNPFALQRGMEAIPANGLVRGLKDCCNNVSSIQRVLTHIDKDVKSMKNLGIKRPDLITEEDLEKEKGWIRFPVLLLLGTAATASAILYSFGSRHLNLK